MTFERESRIIATVQSNTSMPISKYINKVAAEIEGIWFNIPGLSGGRIADSGISVIHDGSVQNTSKYPKRILMSYDDFVKKEYYPIESLKKKGEIVSEPYESSAELSAWMLKNWPDITNKSCGLHFHISVNKNGYYSCLMDPKFYDFYKKSLSELIKKEKLNKNIQDRFNNKSSWAQTYCEDNFRPEKQFRVNKKVYRHNSTDRYAQLNYCWSLHSTLEVRVFSAHCSPRAAVKCLMWWINLIETYLEENYENFINNKCRVEPSISFSLDDSKENISDSLNEKEEGSKNTDDEDILYFESENNENPVSAI